MQTCLGSKVHYCTAVQGNPKQWNIATSNVRQTFAACTVHAIETKFCFESLIALRETCFR